MSVSSSPSSASSSISSTLLAATNSSNGGNYPNYIRSRGLSSMNQHHTASTSAKLTKNTKATSSSVPSIPLSNNASNATTNPTTNNHNPLIKTVVKTKIDSTRSGKDTQVTIIKNQHQSASNNNNNSADNNLLSKNRVGSIKIENNISKALKTFSITSNAQPTLTSNSHSSSQQIKSKHFAENKSKSLHHNNPTTASSTITGTHGLVIPKLMRQSSAKSELELKGLDLILLNENNESHSLPTKLRTKSTNSYQSIDDENDCRQEDFLNNSNAGNSNNNNNNNQMYSKITTTITTLSTEVQIVEETNSNKLASNDLNNMNKNFNDKTTTTTSATTAAAASAGAATATESDSLSSSPSPPPTLKLNNQETNNEINTTNSNTNNANSSNSSSNNNNNTNPTNCITSSSSSSVTVSGSSTSTFNSLASSPSCSSPTSSSRNQMPFKIRSSKYRHVYGNAHKEDVCYKNIKITKNAAHDSAFCAVNPKFVAIVTEECGGGAFIVIPIKSTGRIDINMPKVSGHRGPVLDLKWNPFNDNEIASCSEDTTIKVWQIDDDGLYENLNEWIVDLHGHQRKVGQIEWHPTAENIMISSGADFQVIVWNLERAEPIRIITCHNDTIQSMNWNRDGSLFATTCKDKKIRVIDPRTGIVVADGEGHQGSKISKVVVLGCGTRLFTTGFSRLSERQIALWNIKDLSKPIQMEVVDCSSGIMIPYYDHDTKIVFVAGKGDGNIRYYELTENDPYIHYLSEYKSSAPQRGLGWMPKRGLDVTKNEIFRFYKLHATGNICEPISMIVPRKSEVFQEDIYPDTLSGIPSISCEEWTHGENRDPILISMKDGAVSFMPKIVTYKQLSYSELGNNNNNNNTNYNNHNYHMSSSTNNNTTTTNGYHHNNTNKNHKQSFKSNHNNNGNGNSNGNGNGNGNINSNNQNETKNQTHQTIDSFNTKTKLSSNSRSAFTNYNKGWSSMDQQQISSPPLTPSQKSKHPKMVTDNQIELTNSSFNGNHQHNHFNNNNGNNNSHHYQNSSMNNSHNTTNNDDLTLEAYVNGKIIEETSSNESMNRTNEENIAMFKSISNNNNNTNKMQNNDLEASYLTSVSKNPITLRKTESLKLDSVQSIRNRFNRVNSHTLGALTRNAQSTNRYNLESTNSKNNSNENLNKLLSTSTSNDENDQQPPPPNLIQSPALANNSNTTTTTAVAQPLLISTTSISSSSSTNTSNNNNNHANTNGSTEYFGLVSTSSLNVNNNLTTTTTNVGCVKKRVWTPVQTNLKSCDLTNGNTNGNTQTTMSELQKSYFRVLEEKNNLKEQLAQQEKKNKQLEEELSAKDKRIQYLENKLNLIMMDSKRTTEPDTTDC